MQNVRKDIKVTSELFGIKPPLSINTTWKRARRFLGVAINLQSLQPMHLLAAGTVGIGLGLFMVLISTIAMRWQIILFSAALLPFVLLIVRDIQRLFLGAILLDIPLQFDTHFGYRAEVGNLGAIGGWNVSITTLALIALYGLWVIRWLVESKWANKRAPLPSIKTTSLLLGLYVFFAIISGLMAQDKQLASFEIVLLIQMFLLHIYILGTTRSREDVRFIVSMLLIGVVVESIIMIASNFVPDQLAFLGVNSYRGIGDLDSTTRVGGTLHSPNIAGGYLSLVLGLALAVLLTDENRRFKWLAGLAFCLGGIALVLTFSRGGWIAFGVSIIVLIMAAWYRGWFSSKLLFGIVIVGIVFLLPLGSVILTRLTGDDGRAAYGRVPLMRLAFEVINDYPAFGIGTNNFVIGLSEYATAEFAKEWLYTVHNKYLLVWAEVGTSGFLAFVSYLFSILFYGWRSWLRQDRFLSLIALGLTAGVMGHMTHMFVEIFNSRPAVQLLWLNAAVVMAIASLTDANTKQVKV